MSTIRLPSIGTVEERLQRIEQAINFGEEILCCGIIDEQTGAVTNLDFTQIVGGWTIPWETLRKLLPDARWSLWAAGWADCTGTGFLLQLAYQKNDFTPVVLGQQSYDALPYTKVVIGPFAARGPLIATLCPEEEPIHSLNLSAAVGGGGTLTLRRWTMWLRMSPRGL